MTTRSRRLPLLAAALLVLSGTAVGAVPADAAPAPHPVGPAAHTVGYDHHSLLLDGRRVMVQAAEFHYFRLPSPDLWRDVLEKFRAGGFNTVSLYLDWAYHSPKPGVYDFSGVRDIDRLLGTVDDLGMYAIVRPGPYINAETTGGGFPAWLKTVPGRARSSAPGYTQAYRDWLGQVNPILARHQATRGGSIILYNAENEYAVNTDAVYMEDLRAQARAAGIDVPITTNDCCDAGSWSSTWVSGPGAVDLPGVDDYPQSFECQTPDVWGPWGTGLTERLGEEIPVYAAEYQAGAIDLNNAGYDACRELTGPAFMKFFYKSNLVQAGATLNSYYMGFGGTNWGWLAQPNDVYTSYDYGAAITEARQLTAKYDEFKRQGLFVQAVAPLAKTDPVTGPVSDNPLLETVARANPETGTQVVLVRHSDRAATTRDTARLDWATPDGRYVLPVTVAGRDASTLLAGYDLGGQRLVVSSSQLMTHAAIGGRDVAVLYGTAGTAGRSVLRYPSRPSVRVLQGSAGTAFDAATGDLTLDYRHGAATRLLVSGGGRRPLLLLLGDDAEAASFWRADTESGPVLVRGTSLLRSASIGHGTLALRADTERAGAVEVFGPSASRLTVNGQEVPVRRSAAGGLLGALPGPQTVTLPALTSWRAAAEAPEAAPGFDDSRWTVADKTSSLSPTPPITRPVLFADEYGYHYGSVWYRGRFTATGAEAMVKLNAITGKRGVYLAWLNGRFLGSAAGGVEADGENPAKPDPGPGQFAVPAGLLRPGEPATLSVLVENMGHNDDWTAEESRQRQPRGLIGAALRSADGATLDAGIGWRIQGAAGGEDLPDRVRGPLNTGGLYGERAGWHLPGFPDRSMRPAAPSSTVVAPGVSWLRTTFHPDLPAGHDVSVALRFAGGSGRYRVMIFLNGWNVGQYGAAIGPQQDFVLPAGILHGRGENSLALAVIAEADSVVGDVSLVAAGRQWGGVAVHDVPAPGYRR